MGVVLQTNSPHLQLMIVSNNRTLSYVFVQYEHLCNERCCEGDQKNVIKKIVKNAFKNQSI